MQTKRNCRSNICNFKFEIVHINYQFFMHDTFDRALILKAAAARLSACKMIGSYHICIQLLSPLNS